MCPSITTAPASFRLSSSPDFTRPRSSSSSFMMIKRWPSEAAKILLFTGLHASLRKIAPFPPARGWYSLKLVVHLISSPCRSRDQVKMHPSFAHSDSVFAVHGENLMSNIFALCPFKSARVDGFSRSMTRIPLSFFRA